MRTIRDIYNQNAKEYIASIGEDLQEYELPTLEKFLGLLPERASVLDVGCGSGKHANWLQEQGCQVMAVDISDEMVKYALEHFPGLRMLRGTVESVPEETFDAVWCLRVFHHIPIVDQDTFLDEIVKRLKKTGVLYITCVHDNITFEKYDSVGGVLKKRLTKASFRVLLQSHNLAILGLNDWGNGHAEYFCRKLLVDHHQQSN